MSTATFTATAPASALRMPRLSRGGVQVGIFVLAYLVYSLARYVTVGSLPDAESHAHWIVNLEKSTSTNIEGSVQTALTGTPVLWILNHLYLAAQLSTGYKGRLGADVDPDTGRLAARAAMLNLLANTEVALGTLDRVGHIVMVTGFVCCTERFTGQAAVHAPQSDEACGSDGAWSSPTRRGSRTAPIGPE